MRLRRALAATAAVLSLAACGADGGAAEVPAAAGQEPASAAQSAGLVGGGTIDPVALSEATPVALWFWAPG
ncbi:MAG: hypothetical protein ACO36A_10140 [Ilumatobacteraceae bacterium]